MPKPELEPEPEVQPEQQRAAELEIVKLFSGVVSIFVIFVFDKSEIPDNLALAEFSVFSEKFVEVLGGEIFWEICKIVGKN